MPLFYTQPSYKIKFKYENYSCAFSFFNVC